jgi:transcriptional regulator with XRE-family HTH domain
MDLTPEQEAESRRIAALLHSLVKFSGRSMRSIEEELGVGSSSLAKVLKGAIQLQFGHILKILDVLDVSPAQFFHVAYSGRVRANKLVEQWRRYEEMDAGRDETSEALVRRVVREIFGELSVERDLDEPRRR